MEDNHANEKLVSLSHLREFTSKLERWDSRITLVQGSLTLKRTKLIVRVAKYKGRRTRGNSFRETHFASRKRRLIETVTEYTI